MSAAAALQLAPPNDSADLLTLLNDFLLRVSDGPVVLLRPLPNAFDSRRDDVDLLLTEHQRTELLHVAFEASGAGHLHMRVRQASAEKIQLVFWSLDCTSTLTVDLWSVFSQLPHYRGKGIRADYLLKMAASEAERGHGNRLPLGSPLNAAIQMPADMDLCLLILHLVSKKKRLLSPIVRQRLILACDRLRRLLLQRADSSPFPSDVSLLLNSAEQLLYSVRIPPQLVRDAETYLLERVRDSAHESGQRIPEPRGSRSLLTRTRRWLMKSVPCLAVVGSDGAGKSSVCRALAESPLSNFRPCVGKKLYRRSLLYQLLSGTAKRVRGVERGQFDDSVSCWITLRASIALWCRLVDRPAAGAGWAINEAGACGWAVHEAGACGWAVNEELPMHPNPHLRRTLLLDRSVASFLIVDRKSPDPQLHRSASWLERLIPPVTTLLLAVPFSQLVRRKQEMSCQGHEKYQLLLFQQALRQQPADVIVIANTQSADDAARVIRAICCDFPLSAVSVVTKQAALAKQAAVAEEAAA